MERRAAIALALALSAAQLAACADYKPFQPPNNSAIPEGPGLLTGSEGEWVAAGRPDAPERAHARVRDLLDPNGITPPDAAVLEEMESIITDDARSQGIYSLPDWKCSLP